AASGNVTVPISTLLQPPEIAYILNNSQASCVVTTTELLPKVQAIRERVPALRKIIVVGDATATGDFLAWDKFLADQTDTYTLPRPLAASDVVAFLYTSGTTGFPKAAMVSHGGPPLPTAVQEKFIARYGLPILEGYGCSEASSTVTVMPIHGPYKPLSVGKVMPNQRLRIVDDEGRDVRDGEEGEIIVRGPNVCRGYYGLPAATRQAIRGGWLYTGDLGRL